MNIITPRSAEVVSRAVLYTFLIFLASCAAGQDTEPRSFEKTTNLTKATPSTDAVPRASKPDSPDDLALRLRDELRGIPVPLSGGFIEFDEVGVVIARYRLLPDGNTLAPVQLPETPARTSKEWWDNLSPVERATRLDHWDTKQDLLRSQDKQ